jgi:hypothetical protein
MEELNGPSLLADITELTGGRVFAVEHLNDLPDIASKIGMELRNQYVLGYRPSNHAHDARGERLRLSCARPKDSAPHGLLKNRLLRACALTFAAARVKLRPCLLSS